MREDKVGLKGIDAAIMLPMQRPVILLVERAATLPVVVGNGIGHNDLARTAGDLKTPQSIFVNEPLFKHQRIGRQELSAAQLVPRRHGNVAVQIRRDDVAIVHAAMLPPLGRTAIAIGLKFIELADHDIGVGMGIGQRNQRSEATVGQDVVRIDKKHVIACGRGHSRVSRRAQSAVLSVPDDAEMRVLADDLRCLRDAVVRAAVIIYMQENGFAYDQVKKEMCAQVGRDFLWMPELVTTLRYYSKHRNRYKTLDNYYPEIAKCLKKYLKEEMKRIEKSL